MVSEPKRYFGVIPTVPDPRNAAYTMSSVSERVVGAPASKMWTPCPVKNQGQAQACIPYSWRAWMESLPVADKSTFTPDVQGMYAQMQGASVADPNQGCPVGNGPSVMRALGRLSSYVWGSSAAEVRDFICAVGGVTLATPWFTSMSSPDSRGVLIVDPSSGATFLHQVFFYGYDATTNEFLGQNSWGTSWGVKGRFRLRFADLDVLFHGGATACAGAELANPDAQSAPDPDPDTTPPKKTNWFIALLRAIFRRR